MLRPAGRSTEGGTDDVRIRSAVRSQFNPLRTPAGRIALTATLLLILAAITGTAAAVRSGKQAANIETAAEAVTTVEATLPEVTTEAKPEVSVPKVTSEATVSTDGGDTDITINGRDVDVPATGGTVKRTLPKNSGNVKIDISVRNNGSEDEDSSSSTDIDIQSESHTSTQIYEEGEWEVSD